MSDSNGYYDFEDKGPVREEEDREHFWKGLSLGLAVAAAVALVLTALNVRTSLQARKIRDLYAGQAQIQTPAASGEESGQSGQSEQSRRDEKIRLLEQYIDAYFYQSEEVDESERAEGIYRGLLESLEDPYSVYYSAEDYAALNSQLAGAYSGIGAYIGLNTES
ncbi:MAG: hypothetical protein ACSW8K_01310, partial [bacterium]